MEVVNFMQNKEVIDNTEIEETAQKLLLNHDIESMGRSIQPFLEQLKNGGKVFVTVDDSAGDEDLHEKPASIFIEDLNELWVVAYTNENEYAADNRKIIRTIKWEELMRMVINDELFTGAVLNPAGKRFPMPQEFMEMIMKAYDESED